MSYHRLQNNPLNTTLRALMKRGAHLGLGVGAFTPILALANPSGGHVAAGQASIATSNANGLVVKETSQSAIINWQQFSIGSGQYVQFIQPSSSSVVLNRVVGGNASQIFGSLTANGQVFLINPNGVFFDRGSTLDAQGLVASTLDIKDSDFLARNYVFQKGTGAPDAQIVNQGSITAHNGGYVVLAGDYAENDGLIAARSGHVVLASGTKATLGLSGNSLVSFAVDQATLARYAGVANAGSLLVDGGTVVMTADVANQLRATVVNNSGLIEARGLLKIPGGIYLTATGGNIENSGTLDADALDPATRGGHVVLKGDGLLDLTPTSKITALGYAARGGEIDFFANDAKFGGQFQVGRGGTLVLDPATITINSGPTGSHTNTIGTNGINGIDTKLNAGSNVVISAGASILKGTATGITATGTGNLTLNIGNGGTINLSGVSINIKSDLKTNVHTHGSFTSASFKIYKATEEFGPIAAKDVILSAGSGEIILAKATTVSGVVTPSVKTTGNIVINSAGFVNASSFGNLNMSAGGNVVIHGTQANFFNSFVRQTGDVANSSGNVTLKGTNVDVGRVAGGSITVKGHLANSTGGALSHGLDLSAAARVIKLDHGVTADGNITFTAAKLVYTGTNPFTVKAHDGSIH